MRRVDKNNFSYKKNLLAFEPTSFNMRYTGGDLYEMTINVINIGEDKDKNSLKYISVGVGGRYFRIDDEDLDPATATYEKFINNSEDFGIRFDKRYDLTLKVYEDGTFWDGENLPIDTLYPLVKKFEKILKDFIITKSLPEDYDYWFKNGKN